MKKLTLTIITIAGFFAAQAQINQRCGIYYDYDASGNRIKRYYDCKLLDASNPSDGTGPVVGPIARMANTGESDALAPKITIYPNPANDFVNIKLMEPAEHVHFHLYDGKGTIIQSGDISGQEYRCNLSSIASGLYHLNILYKGKPYSFKITKL